MALKKSSMCGSEFGIWGGVNDHRQTTKFELLAEVDDIVYRSSYIHQLHMPHKDSFYVVLFARLFSFHRLLFSCIYFAIGIRLVFNLLSLQSLIKLHGEVIRPDRVLE